MICRVTDKSGYRVEVSPEVFFAIVGDREIAPLARDVYKGKISLDDVPVEHRDTVAAIVAAREEFSGPYQLTAEEALAELMGVLE